MAYGARLESVLGESPQGFESPILRQSHESPDGPRSGGALLVSRPASPRPGPSAPHPAPPSEVVPLYPGRLRMSPIEPLPTGAART